MPLAEKPRLHRAGEGLGHRLLGLSRHLVLGRAEGRHLEVRLITARPIWLIARGEMLPATISILYDSVLINPRVL